jgi:quinol monooxygenase YgiN
MTELKHMRLEYRIRPDVDVEAVYLPLVTGFVASMRAHHASHDYTAYRDAKDPHHFVHVGHFDASVVPDMQAQAWFTTFTGRLRELTVAPPDVVMLGQIAATRP